MHIVKGPIKGYASELNKKFRVQENNLVAGRALVKLQSEGSSGVLVSNGEGLSVDLTATAIAAGKSLHVEDQRTKILLSLIDLIARARHGDLSEVPKEILANSLQAARILNQVFEGDMSHPSIPEERLQAGQARTEQYLACAYAMTLVHMRERLDEVSLDDASDRVAEDLDDGLQRLARIRLWDAFPRKADGKGKRNRRRRADVRQARHQTDKERRAAVAQKILRWIKEERSAPRSAAALPPQSDGARYYAEHVRLIEKHGVWPEIYGRLLQATLAKIILTTPAAQDQLKAVG